VIVDCMTDNRVRTVAEVRHAFSKYGGNEVTIEGEEYTILDEDQIYAILN